jgi:hypothetical protein
MEALDVSNAAAATAAPKEVKLGDKTYTLSRLNMKGIGLIQEMINALPRPDLIPQLRKDLEGLPPETFQAILLPAAIKMSNWPPDLLFNDEAVIEVTKSAAIMKRLVYLSLSRNHPEVTQEKADALFDDMIQEEFNQVLKAALNLKEVAEKKAEAQGAGENGTTTSVATAT